jgi:hypothetical protein
MKIRLVGADLLQAESQVRWTGRTDRRDEANGRSNQFFQCAWNINLAEMWDMSNVAGFKQQWLKRNQLKTQSIHINWQEDEGVSLKG